MLAPCVFKQINGYRIAIEAYDVYNVTETDDGVQILFLSTDAPDIVTVVDEFDDILNRLAEARREAIQQKPREGDEWKDGPDSY